MTTLVAVAVAASQNRRLHSHLERCVALREADNITGSADCMTQALAHHHWLAEKDVLDYFELSPPTVRPESFKRHRLQACDDPHFDWQLVRRVAILWNASSLGPCLWANMLPHQLALIVGLARAMSVTHIVECGRMGGLPLLHYSHFGFNVTSFELSPIPWVKEALASIAPQVGQIDGDCIEGIPLLLQQIHASEPAARVGIVFDGPKGYGVFKHANRLAEDAAFIVVDDQSMAMLALQRNFGVQPRWPYLDESAASLFESWVPMKAMAAAFREAEEAPWMARPNGQSKTGVKIRVRPRAATNAPYSHDLEGHPPTQMIMLGGRWRWAAKGRVTHGRQSPS